MKAARRIITSVPISPREFALLHALLERPGQILSRGQLEDRLYGWGEEVESNVVEVHIHTLRRKLGADFIAVSFCRSAADIELARELARAAGSDAQIVAKIERAEAIENLVEIVEAAEVIMVARGDLGVEIGYAELPGLQKKIIRESVARNRIVITATQMLQSMVDNPIPTRAEVLDVANSVIDSSDTVMLSA
jgi:pyruvate kinase